MYSLWVAILETGFGGDKYTPYTMGIYYIAISFATFFCQFNPHIIAMEIRRGAMSVDMLRPWSYFCKYFLLSVAEKVILFSLFVSLLFFFILGGKVAVIAEVGMLQFLVSIILAMFMGLFLSLILGGLAFWFKRIYGFASFYNTVGGLFTGTLIPTDLLPKDLLVVSAYLPFQYTYFTPVQFLLKSVSFWEAVRIYSIQISWIILGYLLAKYIWEKGLRGYEAAEAVV
jgi:ABC-2 type transport system permease protein